MIENTISFKDITVILPVINEKISIDKTIHILLKNNYKDISEILFVISKEKTETASRIKCHYFHNLNKEKIKILYQKKKNLGGAMMDAFKIIKSSHCLMMSSDLETNPETVKKMIKISKINPNKIITATRWLKGKRFVGYGYIKTILNLLFQKIFSYVFKTNCTDLTFGFRIFPKKVIQSINWEMNDHSFLFETFIKPLKNNIEIIEVESNWKKRIEGKTNNKFSNYFKYFYIGFKVLALKKN